MNSERMDMSRLRTGMANMTVFLALATHSYVEDIRRGDPSILEQIALAREYDVGVFILYVAASEKDQTIVEKIFQGSRVLKRVHCKGPEDFEKFMPDLRAAAESEEKRRGLRPM